MPCREIAKCVSLPAWTITSRSRFASISWSRRSTAWRCAMAADMSTNHAPAVRPARRRASTGTISASVAEAIAIARDFARAGQHAQAVDIVSDALAQANSDADASLSLLELRAESLVAAGEMDRALGDAEAM